MTNRTLISIEHHPIIYLTVIWLLAITIRICLFTGYMNGDMGNYIQEAYNIFNGNYSVKKIFQQASIEQLYPNPNFNWQNLRLGLIVPVGFLMKLFGVSEFSYAVFTFGCFTLGFIIVYLFGKELISKSFGVFSAVFFAFIPLEINLSTVLVPHIPAASLMATSCYLLLKGCRSEGKRSLLLTFFSGMALGIAYLIWEFALVLVPVLFTYLAMALGLKSFVVSKKFWASCLSFLIGFTSLFVVEVIYFYHITGIVLFRQKFISLMGPKWLELHPIDMINLKWDIYPKAMFSSYHFGAFYYFVLAGLLITFFHRACNKVLYKQRAALMFLPVVWLLGLGLYLQFGTSSLSSYQAIFKMSHYLVVLSIPASLIAAYFLLSCPWDVLINKMGLSNKEKLSLYIPGSLLALFVLSSALCSYINFSGNGPFHRDMTYEHRIKQALDKLSPQGPIYTDTWTKHGLDFVYRYKRQIVAIDSPMVASQPQSLPLSEIKNGYLVVNRIYLGSGHVMGVSIPDYIFKPLQGWKLEARVWGKAKSIDIYRLS